MKVQGNRYINNPEMIKNKVEKKTTVPQNIISEDDVKISDSARKLVETARDKVSDFQAMHFSSINGEIKEIPAEYKCENLFPYIFSIMHFFKVYFFNIFINFFPKIAYFSQKLYYCEVCIYYFG